MKEAFERMLAELNAEIEWAETHGKDRIFRDGRISGLLTAKRIVRKMAEEKNNEKSV